MTTTVFDRTQKSGQASPTQSGQDVAAFNSAGIAQVSDPATFLAKYGGLELVGTPSLKKTLAAQGDATTTYTVPTGKSWRLLSMILRVVSDATVGNRTVTVTTPGDTIVLANQAASNTVVSEIVFSDNTQGNARVEPAGTLTIAEQVSTTDTMTINGVTFTFLTTLTGAANEIQVGSTEAATKVNIEAAIGATPTAGNHSVTDAVRDSLDVTCTDFTGDDLTLTYSGSGSATGDGEAVTLTETFTHVSNIFDGATLGTAVAGVGAGTKEGTTQFPGAGVILSATETVVVTEPAVAAAGDDIDIWLTYIEYDAEIT